MDNKIITPDHPRSNFFDVVIDGENTTRVSEVDPVNQSVTLYVLLQAGFFEYDGEKFMPGSDGKVTIYPETCTVTDRENSEVVAKWDYRIEVVTEMLAAEVQLDCPHCGETQTGFYGDPRNEVFDCEDCGKKCKVHRDADIEMQ